MQIALLMAGALSLLVHIVVARNRVSMISPSGIFGVVGVLTLAGTILEADWTNATDSKYIAIVGYSVICYNLAAAIAIAALNLDSRAHLYPRISPSPIRAGYLAAVAVSIAVVVLYYQTVGYSAFAEGLAASVSGNEVDVATLRLESYSGTRYLFPGYVNQFKNALLPALAIVGIISARSAVARVAFGTVAAIAIFGLVGTGQRGAFFIFVAITVVFLFFWTRSNRLSKPGLVASVTIAASVLVASTIALGRNRPEASSSSIQSAGYDLVDRVFLVNPRAGIAAFRYTETLSVEHPGQEWIRGLLSVLPGVEGSSIAREVFATIYGSDRGTTPQSLWGSIHFNFGLSGTLIAPVLLAFIFAVLTRSMQSSENRNVLEMIGISGVTIVLGVWMTDGPLFLLNSGLVVYCVLWLAGRNIRQRASNRTPQIELSPISLPKGQALTG